MKFDIYLPCERLTPYIKHLAISEPDAAGPHVVWPDTSPVMGFQYRGRLAYHDQQSLHHLATAGITGLLDQYRTFINSPGTGTVLVVFRETGAAAFLRQPLHTLLGESLSLEHCFTPAAIREVEDCLGGAQQDAARIAVVENFLLAHLQDTQPDMLVQQALQLIHQSKGTIRIADLAARLYISQSPLEKRFRRLAGASPKKFATIVRARNMMAALDADNIRMAEYLSGYYDQAHFIHDFKRFTGLTPEAYRRSR